jgi:hypothetical protein
MNCLTLKPNPTSMKARLLPVALLTVLMSPASKLSAQSSGQLYALGFNMGLASFQASVVTGGSNDFDFVQQAWWSAGQALGSAVKVRDEINSSRALLTDTGLEKFPGMFLNVRSDDIGYYKEAGKDLYSRIVAIREGYTAQLAKNGMNNLLHAYVLGVNIGIAEGQATAGEAARQIVYSSLINAKSEAQALDLDLNPLNECISLANTTTPMAEVYQKIVSLRSVYQSSLR